MKTFNRGLRITGNRRVVGGTTNVRIYLADERGRPTLCSGVTVPTDGESGYAKGCIFLDQDVGAGSSGFYENVGTITAANFDVIGAGGGGSTTYVGLTDVPANYTGDANMILKVNNGETAVEHVAVSGDVAMSAAGVMTVADLTIASEATGTLLQYTGAGWEILAAGTNGYVLKAAGAGVAAAWADPATLPTGIAAGVSQAFTMEAGTNDIVHSVTSQSVGSPTLTIPDFANVDDEYVFKTKAVTLANKTLTSPIIAATLVLAQTTGNYTITQADPAAGRAITLSDPGGADEFAWLAASQAFTNKTYTSPIIVTTDSIVDAGGDAYLTFVESGTPRDSVQITQGDAGAGATIESITADTNANLLLDAAGSGDVQIKNGTELSFLRATQDALIVVADQTGEDHTFNIPDIATGASDTFAFLAEAQALTNKSIDADANTLTNVNADELDPVVIPSAGDASDSVYGVSSVIMVNISNQAAAVNVYSSNAPFKFRIVRAWSINESTDGGTWKLNNGAGGGGTDITNAVTVAGDDQDLDEPTDYDNAVQDIASSGSLSVVPDGGGTLDCTIYIQIIRVA